MSGPKVIDVVTRQELIDSCKAILAEVDYAIKEWQRVMDRNMIVAADELTLLTKAHDELVDLLKADRFQEIQVFAPRLTASIHRHVQNKLAIHNAQANSAHVKEKSTRLSARTVMARCQEMGLDLLKEDEKVLADAVGGHIVDADVLRQALSRTQAAIQAKETAANSATQRDLASLLGATGEILSASEILKTIEESLADPRIGRISHQITELATAGEDKTASEFRSHLDRATRAEEDGDMRQRGLLLDSLEVALAPAIKRARQTHELRRDIGVESAAAQATNDLEACRVELREAEVALQRGETDSARLHLERAKTTRLDRCKQRAAQSSRAAILDGLKELGYEVREGMATQWAEKNQLVVGHAAKPGVALELAGTLDGGRLQARMVALQGSARDPHADKQTEETWCSEFDSLQKYLARRGGEIKVVKAVAAGAAPLKVVTDDLLDEERRHPQTRERERP